MDIRPDLLAKLKRTRSDRQIAEGIQKSEEWARQARPDPEAAARLRELMQPFLEQLDDSRHTFEMLTAMAVNAWNVALMPLADRAAFMEQFLWIYPENARALVSSITEGMCFEKRRLFPDDRRYVADADVAEADGRFALIVKVLPRDPAFGEELDS